MLPGAAKFTVSEKPPVTITFPCESTATALMRSKSVEPNASAHTGAPVHAAAVPSQSVSMPPAQFSGAGSTSPAHALNIPISHVCIPPLHVPTPSVLAGIPE